MDRNARALIIALLCVLAVSLAAATLANPQEATGTGPGSGDAPQQGETDRPASSNGSKQGAPQKEGGNAVMIGGACIPFLLSPTFYLIALVAIVVATWALKRRRNLVYSLAVVGPVTLFLFPLWLFMTDCGTPESGEPRGELFPETNTTDAVPSPGGEAGGEAANQLLSPPMLLAVLVLVAVVFAVLVYRASGDDTVDEETDPVFQQPEPEDEEALAAVGAAAGEAADRIEEAADVENEVYRAWREMTDHVDVAEPATSTPREFAEAARDAGMAGRHVDTLTELFRDVRYGGADATEDRETRAVDALRAIEDEYAGLDAEVGSGTGAADGSDADRGSDTTDGGGA